MRPRVLEFRLPRLRGFQGVVMITLMIGLLALVLFLGAVVAVVGLAASVAAALYFGARRFLASGLPPREPRVENRPASQSLLQVREIDVEVLPDNARR